MGYEVFSFIALRAFAVVPLPHPFVSTHHKNMTCNNMPPLLCPAKLTNPAPLKASPPSLASLKDELKSKSLILDQNVLDLLVSIEDVVNNTTREAFVASKTGAIVKRIGESSQHAESKQKALDLMAKWKLQFSAPTTPSTTSLADKPVAVSVVREETNMTVDHVPSSLPKKQKLSKVEMPIARSDLTLPSGEKRQKIVHLLKGIFVKDAQEFGDSVILERCIDMEAVLHALPSAEFPAKYQMWKVQLPKNDELRRFLLMRDMEVEKLLTMTSDDMLPSATRLLQEKLLFEKSESRRSDWADANRERILKSAGVETTEGFFTCPQCESDNTTFYQKQTRGADEPMTVFVQCLACKHQWRTE